MTTEQVKHWAGPWTYHIGEDYTEFYDAEENTVMVVRFAMDEPMARLIAAAPDYHENSGNVRVCLALLADRTAPGNRWEDNAVHVKCVDTLERHITAIARATGATP